MDRPELPYLQSFEENISTELEAPRSRRDEGISNRASVRCKESLEVEDECSGNDNKTEVAPRVPGLRTGRVELVRIRSVRGGDNMRELEPIEVGGGFRFPVSRSRGERSTRKKCLGKLVDGLLARSALVEVVVAPGRVGGPFSYL